MAVPEEGVRLTPVMVTANERIDVDGGGVSGFADMVRSTEPLPAPPPPPPPLFLGSPLQPQRAAESAKAMSGKTVRFIQDTPRQKSGRRRAGSKNKTK